jgi:hypothetical protein
MSDLVRDAAVERLLASRNRLRLALQERGGDAGGPTTWAGLAGMASLPGAAMVLDALRGWWRRHPLHAAGSMAIEVGRPLLRSAADRHPWLLMGAAVLTGVLLVRWKPWKVAGGVLAALAPQLLTALLAQATPKPPAAPPAKAP